MARNVRLRTAISGQRGQSSAEYIAALLLVAAIIAVVVASPVGPQVRAAVGELSCKLLSDDGACGGEVAQPPGLAPGEPDGAVRQGHLGPVCQRAALGARRHDRIGARVLPARSARTAAWRSR